MSQLLHEIDSAVERSHKATKRMRELCARLATLQKRLAKEISRMQKTKHQHD